MYIASESGAQTWRQGTGFHRKLRVFTGNLFSCKLVASVTQQITNASCLCNAFSLCLDLHYPCAYCLAAFTPCTRGKFGRPNLPRTPWPQLPRQTATPDKTA